MWKIFSIILICYLQKVLCNNNTRIIGGNLTDINIHPYQVSMQFFGQHFCGGSLISATTVLSAAHCYSHSIPKPSTFYSVKLGNTSYLSGISYKIKSVLVHQKYNNKTVDYDISIVTLKENVTFTATIQPIQISKNDHYFWGTYATVTGWGFDSEDGSLSEKLREVNVPLIQPQQCKKYYKNSTNISSNMLCAGFFEGGRDACQGDSGGPLVQNGKQIGIVSFGVGCARTGFPGVYTNVANFAKWIEENSDYSRSCRIIIHISWIFFIIFHTVFFIIFN